MSTVGCADTPRFASPQIALPPTSQVPVIDGTIHDDEWAGAVRMVGVVPAGSTALSARRAVSWLAGDDERIYFAVKSEAPPDGILAANVQPTKDDRDLRTIKDDSVEVWLDPHPGEKGRGVYQGIFNPLGAIFDQQHEPSANWRGDWRLSGELIGGWWHFEGSVSLESLGVKAPLAGQVWAVRLARNWKRPGEQADWAPLATQFASRDTMSVVRWVPNAPITQMMANRAPDSNRAQYTLRILNPHAQPLAVRVQIDSQPESSQHARVAETYEIPTGRAQQVMLDHPACHEEEKIYTRIHVDAPGGAAIYFHREFTWTLARPEKLWAEVRAVLSPLERIKQALLFHASFDEGPDADFAGGKPEARPVEQPDSKLQFVPGLSGKALLGGDGCVALEYENAGNFNISEGTVSLWVNPVRWAEPGGGDRNHLFFLNGRAGKGYFGFQMARYTEDAPTQVQFFMIQYPYRQGVHILARDDVPTWKPDEWHWVVMTWRADEVTLCVDGLVRGRRGIDPPLAERDLTWPYFQIGATNRREQTAIDEVKIFGRCLGESELRLARAFCRSSAEAAAWEAVQLDFGHYPCQRKLKARVDINALAGSESVRGARLVVRPVGGAALATVAMPPFEDGITEVIADLPELATGRYELALQLDGAPEALSHELVREFERTQFEWENNQIGTGDLILPPFTPMQVDGRTVSTVLREHTMSGQGLWEQVISGGEGILAEPIRFEAGAGGRQLEIKADDIRFAERTETRVTAQSRWSAGDARAEVTSRMDYDGMMLCELELSGAGSLHRLDLVVPLKDEMAPLAHMVGEHCRDNYAGYVPEGRGVVWDSSKTVKHELVGPFCPYIWVGAEERGICWFAENDRDWAVDGETPCQQIEREGGVLTIRVRIIQKPTELSDAPRRIVFGLQATPAKPMPTRPAHWRKWSTSHDVPGAMTFTIAGSTHYIGSLVHEPFPHSRDLTLWEKFAESRRTGEPDYAFAEQWVDGYPEEAFRSFLRDKYLASVKAGFRMVSQQPQRMLVYVQGRGVTFRTPEFQTFQDEWTMEDYNSRVWPMGIADRRSYGTEPVPSWQDFTLWWLKRQMVTFTDGLYFDNFFMIPVKDRVTSSAYSRPDGQVQPSVSALNTRQMLRRTSIMYLEAGRHPMVGPHMTNVTVIPMMAFSQFCLDWEWHYGRSDFQERWSRDHIRAACMGRQAGCAPVVIGLGARYGGSAEEVEWIHRTFNGVVLTHELIPIWYGVNTHIPYEERQERMTNHRLCYETSKLLLEIGLGTQGCRTYNYWGKDYPLTIEGTETSSVVHRGEGKTVIIVTDWAEGGEVKLTVDAQRLNLKPGFIATEFETGGPVSQQGNTITFDLKKHDYRTIVVED